MFPARRRLLLPALALLLAAPACRSGEPARACTQLPRPPTRDLITFEPIALAGTGIEGGVDLLQAPGGGRWYLVTQSGQIYTFPDLSGAAPPTLFADLSDQIVAGGEAGLLGMAFHPRYAENGALFLSYTGPGGPVFVSRVSRFYSDDGDLTLDLASEEPIFAVDQPYSNHNGGDIAFGPDGLLYFGLGDGGAGGDPQGNAQNPDSLLGKILRVDVDDGAPYAIPADNPHAAGGGRPEIFASGLRNPWRFSFDRQTGDLWAGDVGQNVWEEVDRIELGGNYGWNIKEGPDCFGQDQCDDLGLIDPVAHYRNTGGASVIAGFVYRGADIPAAAGMFLYSDFYSETLWGVVPGQEPVVLATQGVRGISSFAEDDAGELYALDYQGGIYRLGPAIPADGPGLPDMLSETGCLDITAPRAPPPGAIPYDINVPFWSDGADKDRWLFLPRGLTIDVRDDGDWDLPIGSVLVKTFSIADAPIETRLFVRHGDGGWAGYSYAWDPDGGDATLLDGGDTRQFGDQLWTFPDRADCMYCHSDAAGRTLGLETAQLNRQVRGDGGVLVDQLDLLIARGALLTRPESAPLPASDSDAPIDLRARAYLHANCSYCHRPEAPSGRARIDLRSSTPAAEMGLCAATPRSGDLDLTGATLMTPGDPARSILSARMHTLGSTRMPAVASNRVDDAGAALIDAWIAAQTTCPE